MARFRKTNVKPNVTRNLAGAKAYKVGKDWELTSLVLTLFLKDKFYESANDQYQRLVELIGENKPEFVAKLGIYARKVFGMRSVSHVIAAHLPMVAKGQAWLKNAITSMMHRPDDMLEVLSLARGDKSKPNPIANSLSKGLAIAVGGYTVTSWLARS